MHHKPFGAAQTYRGSLQHSYRSPDWTKGPWKRRRRKWNAMGRKKERKGKKIVKKKEDKE